jgi:hypothetical protein
MLIVVGYEHSCIGDEAGREGRSVGRDELRWEAGWLAVFLLVFNVQCMHALYPFAMRYILCIAVLES